MSEKASTIVYRLVVLCLLVILGMTIFYTFFVHIPYLNHAQELHDVRQTIIERDKLTYDNYFYQYNGPASYYIMRVKQGDKSTYLAYDKKLTLVASQQEPFAKQEKVINHVKKHYDLDLQDIQIAYENNIFVYYGKYQDEDHLYYFYYSLANGKFVKSYSL